MLTVLLHTFDDAACTVTHLLMLTVLLHTLVGADCTITQTC